MTATILLYFDEVFSGSNVTPWSIVVRYSRCRIIWSSRPRYWYYQYCKYYNTGNTSIVTLYNTRNTSIVMLQYRKSSIVYIQYWMYQYHPVLCIYNTGIPESLIYAQYRKLQYSSSNNTGNTGIVKHTILEAPVFFIQQYW